MKFDPIALSDEKNIATIHPGQDQSCNFTTIDKKDGIFYLIVDTYVRDGSKSKLISFDS